MAITNITDLGKAARTLRPDDRAEFERMWKRGFFARAVELVERAVAAKEDAHGTGS